MAKKPHPPHPHPHPDNSGIIFTGDTNYNTHTHNHLHAGAQSALQGCLALVRGVATRSDREAVLGHLLAALLHDGSISGLLRVYSRALLHVNHYQADIDSRDH